MKDFVNRIINELKSDSELNENALIKLAIHNADRSIASNDNYDTIYEQLKSSLIGINEHLKNEKIESFLSQFKKNDTTTTSILNEMSKVGNLTERLDLIKESNAYSNPIIKTKVDNYYLALNENSEFQLYPSFVNEFSSHIHEDSVKESIDHINNVLENRASDFEVLNTIQLMESMNSIIYDPITKSLKDSLSRNEYSADVINLMHGETNLPLVTKLVDSLRMIESRSGGSFTLGSGSGDVKIKNLIAPSKKVEEGLLAYTDDRFIMISESELTGDEYTSHINEGFNIATVDPAFVQKNHEDLYILAESYARLGFKSSDLREGVETNSIRNFKVGLNVNENRELDIYLNDNKIEDLNSVNLTEALIMETPDVRNRVEHVFENLSNIITFEFIKTVSSDRMLSEATIYNLGDSYFICENVDAATRVWNKVDELQMFEFFTEKFQYDISPLFKTQIDERIDKQKRIEEAKEIIQANIKKLEGSVTKLNETIEANSGDKESVSKLESLKESIIGSIAKLKEEYIEIDLSKEPIEEGKLPEGLQNYLDKKNGKKEEEGEEKKEDDKEEEGEEKKDEAKEDSEESSEEVNETEEAKAEGEEVNESEESEEAVAEPAIINENSHEAKLAAQYLKS